MNSRQYVTNEYVKDIGWRLYRTVASHPYRISSGKDCTDLIRSVRGRKRKAIKYLVPEIFKLSQWVSDVRDKRRSRMRYIKKHVPGEHGREILRAHIRRLLPNALIETRFSGEYRLQVFVGTPDAKGESSYGERYPGRHKWAKTNVNHRITVMPGWIRLPDSLKVVEGRLVLSAELVADGIYRVVTAVQSRGCALRIEHGWVATCATVDPAFGKTMCAADRKRSLRLQQFMGRAV